MMEDRKQSEINYYDREARNAAVGKESGSLMRLDPFLLGSYRFLKFFLKHGFKDKKVLDYGCGTGVHLPWLAKSFQKVTGIDLSQASLQKAKEHNLQNVTLVEGDCEQMPFPDESFDVVFDGGTFSSLDLETSLKEIHRVLKPAGVLVGIETLGHNPVTNAKRKINEILGKRTSWAARHIFKVNDLEKIKKYFNISQLKFFHLTSFVVFPLLSFPGGKVFLKAFQALDYGLITIFPFLKKYSFKIVFVLQKNDKAIV